VIEQAQVGAGFAAPVVVVGPPAGGGHWAGSYR